MKTNILFLTPTRQNSWSQENVSCISWFIPIFISSNKTRPTQQKPTILITRNKMLSLENSTLLVISCHCPTPLLIPFSTTNNIILIPKLSFPLKGILIINIKLSHQKWHCASQDDKIEGDFQHQDNDRKHPLYTKTLNPYLFVTMGPSILFLVFPFFGGSLVNLWLARFHQTGS